MEGIVEELKLHAEGSNTHIKLIEDTFKALSRNLKSRSDLSEKEKEEQLNEARNVFLKKKKELKQLLF